MSKLYAAEVEDAVAYFLGYWEERKAPSDSSLGRAGKLLNKAHRLEIPLHEETQQQLDELHGLLIWGRLMSAASRLDPRILALERRSQRLKKTGEKPLARTESLGDFH